MKFELLTRLIKNTGKNFFSPKCDSTFLEDFFMLNMIPLAKFA